MRASIALLASAILASSSLGCGATVEVPRICFTQAGLVVPGSPAGADVTSPTFAVTLTDQIPLLDTSTSDADLRLQEVTVTPVAGSPDLSGIQTATVRVRPASGALVDAASYQRNAAAPAPAAIVLKGDTVNVAPDLVSGVANLSFTLSGQPPQTSWTANVETCLRGETSVSP